MAGTPVEALRKARKWLAITGVLAILAGILAIVVPAAVWGVRALVLSSVLKRALEA